MYKIQIILVILINKYYEKIQVCGTIISWICNQTRWRAMATNSRVQRMQNKREKGGSDLESKRGRGGT